MYSVSMVLHAVICFYHTLLFSSPSHTHTHLYICPTLLLFSLPSTLSHTHTHICPTLYKFFFFLSCVLGGHFLSPSPLALACTKQAQTHTHAHTNTHTHTRTLSPTLSIRAAAPFSIFIRTADVVTLPLLLLPPGVGVGVGAGVGVGVGVRVGARRRPQFPPIGKKSSDSSFAAADALVLILAAANFLSFPFESRPQSGKVNDSSFVLFKRFFKTLFCFFPPPGFQ